MICDMLHMMKIFDNICFTFGKRLVGRSGMNDKIERVDSLEVIITHPTCFIRPVRHLHLWILSPAPPSLPRWMGMPPPFPARG